MPKMPTYYVCHNARVIPCFLIREGYIPCDDYRENKNDDYYSAYEQSEFCIQPYDKEYIHENLDDAISQAKTLINTQFNDRVDSAIEDRRYYLTELKNLKDKIYDN